MSTASTSQEFGPEHRQTLERLVREKPLSHPLVTSIACFGFELTPPPHLREIYGAVYRALSDDYPEAHNHLARLMPREHGKTEAGTVVIPTWAALRDPNTRILLMSINADKASDKLSEISEHIEIELTAIGVDVDVGDRITVTLPEEGIDRMLRLTSRREILEATGVSLVLTLTNRLLTGDDSDQKARKDLQRFNRGYEGFVDRDQTSSGWNAAGDGTPQEHVVVDWPDDIVEEQVVTLAVQGRAWRSPVDPQSHDHEVEITIDSHAHDVTFSTNDHAHLLDVLETSGTNSPHNALLTSAAEQENLYTNESWTTLESISTVDEAEVFYLSLTAASTEDISGTIRFRVHDVDNNEYYPESGGIQLTSPSSNAVYTGAQSIPIPDESSSWEIQYQNYSEDTGYATYHYQAWGRHDHEVDISEDTNPDGAESIFETTKNGGGTVKTETTNTTAGAAPSVITTFDGDQFYPSDVTIEVNGTEVGTIAGDSNGKWTETIDLKGYLSPGLNRITATPSTRGELNLSLASELFRRGRTG